MELIIGEQTGIDFGTPHMRVSKAVIQTPMQHEHLSNFHMGAGAPRVMQNLYYQKKALCRPPWFSYTFNTLTKVHPRFEEKELFFGRRHDEDEMEDLEASL